MNKSFHSALSDRSRERPFGQPLRLARFPWTELLLLAGIVAVAAWRAPQALGALS